MNVLASFFQHQLRGSLLALYCLSVLSGCSGCGVYKVGVEIAKEPASLPSPEFHVWNESSLANQPMKYSEIKVRRPLPKDACSDTAAFCHEVVWHVRLEDSGESPTTFRYGENLEDSKTIVGPKPLLPGSLYILSLSEPSKGGYMFRVDRNGNIRGNRMSH